MINTYIFDIIVCKLSHWQKFCSVILLKVYKSSKIGLYCTILAFYLKINLRIKYYKKLLFDAKEVSKQK